LHGLTNQRSVSSFRPLRLELAKFSKVESMYKAKLLADIKYTGNRRMRKTGRDRPLTGDQNHVGVLNRIAGANPRHGPRHALLEFHVRLECGGNSLQAFGNLPQHGGEHLQQRRQVVHK
jgi:hypothetical protein